MDFWFIMIFEECWLWCDFWVRIMGLYIVGVLELEFIVVDFLEYFFLSVEVDILLIFGFKFVIVWMLLFCLVIDGCFDWIGEMVFLLGCLNWIKRRVGKFNDSYL